MEIKFRAPLAIDATCRPRNCICLMAWRRRCTFYAIDATPHRRNTDNNLRSDRHGVPPPEHHIIHTHFLADLATTGQPGRQIGHVRATVITK